ncbi:hypothetical protein KY285_017698 [Solanum tuberosum]|nr:hypothetical protein KY289_017864 [Solanum tuberosum]KAH0703420.1 hypothetical protein KY285_017698 [Solanum tuberosum]
MRAYHAPFSIHNDDGTHCSCATRIHPRVENPLLDALCPSRLRTHPSLSISTMNHHRTPITFFDLLSNSSSRPICCSSCRSTSFATFLSED